MLMAETPQPGPMLLADDSLRATRQLITGLISRELRRGDLSPATFGILDEQGFSSPRRLTAASWGCMNDMAFLC